MPRKPQRLIKVESHLITQRQERQENAMAQQAGVGKDEVKVVAKAEESEDERKSLSSERISSLG